MQTIDYMIVMIGLVFIADSICDAIATYKSSDCEKDRLLELEERVGVLEGKILEII